MQENKNEKLVEFEAAPGFLPMLCLYRPNLKGTGCAIKMELHPANAGIDGSIDCTFANQMTVGNSAGPRPTFPTFDWTAAICVKLGFGDLTKMQQVFRGECESIDEGKGLYHRTARGMTRIVLQHVIDPTPGYVLEVFFKPTGEDEDRHSRIFLTPAEALGISEAISGSMVYVAFGVPAVRNAPSYLKD